MMDFLPFKAISLIDVTRRLDDSGILETVLAKAIYSSRRSRRTANSATADASVDAALALIVTKLPGWVVARIEQDEGEWYCTLSHILDHLQLGDSVTAHHPALAQAILAAYRDARSTGLVVRRIRRHAPADSQQTVCCENYR